MNVLSMHFSFEYAVLLDNPIRVNEYNEPEYSLLQIHDTRRVLEVHFQSWYALLWRCCQNLKRRPFWSKTTLKYWMMVERYPNMKKEVDGSISWLWILLSTWQKLARWPIASCALVLACPPSVPKRERRETFPSWSWGWVKPSQRWGSF